jgi:prepilin-type processing-associated H-X9-DG protein
MKLGRTNRLTRYTKAFALKDLVVTIVVLFLFILFLLPWAASERAKAKGICCNCNLKQIGLSFRQWGLDHNDKYPQQVATTNGGVMEFTGSNSVYLTFLLMSNELSTPKILVCPSDNRTAATDFAFLRSNTNVSYFVSLDAEETEPQMLLSGDRNITNGTQLVNGLLLLATNSAVGWTHELHNGFGNVALADGSVQGFSTPHLQEALQNMGGDGTNRLAIP